MTPIMLFIVGCVLGRIAAGWAAHVLAGDSSTGLDDCEQCRTPCSIQQRWLGVWTIRCRICGTRRGVRWPVVSSLVMGILFTAYAWLLTVIDCQKVAEVQPVTAMHLLRLPYHLALLFLLTVTVLTDLLDYVIPDQVIILGIFVAVAGATMSGDLQVIHVWVNWDAQIPGLNGPYLPEWMKNHQHLHGLIWSLGGMIVGGTFIWLVRGISGWVMGQPTMGYGDVTLMAMIGSFIGWQPALCAIAIAPLTGIVAGLAVRITTGRTYVAFGPYLAVSAVIVLGTWRWIWAEPLLMRIVFSHWPSILGLTGGSLAALAILLGALRTFLTTPAESIRR
ncbi:MAG: A24 family peptidase [Fuerstiella sp.]|nr:A24 family peptidase [Fuerstiella sp.]